MHDSKEQSLILIVDDHVDNVRLLADLLQDKYRVLFATSGAKAIEVANSKQPDLILLDISMPVMDGFEVCKVLKGSDLTKDIPVIFVTALCDEHNEAHGFEIGAVDYLSKPISMPILEARIKIHLTLKKQHQELKDLNRVKDKFIGVVAHDLRNPLGGIQAISKILLEMPDQAETEELLQLINGTAQEALQIVNNLLDLSAIESGSFSIRPNPCRLNEIAENQIRIAQYYADRKKIQLVSDLRETPEMPLDPSALGQVIGNLLSNALKFSKSNTTISVETHTDGSFAIVAVRDQGPGISESDQEKLFDSFQTLSARATAEEKSTGLGLAIVQSIVEAHSGKITVDSAVGQGTEFRVMIPLPSELASELASDLASELASELGRAPELSQRPLVSPTAIRH